MAKRATKKEVPKPVDHTITINYQRHPNGGFTFSGITQTEDGVPLEDVHSLLEFAMSMQKLKLGSVFAAKRTQAEITRRMIQAVGQQGGAQ